MNPYIQAIILFDRSLLITYPMHLILCANLNFNYFLELFTYLIFF